MAQPEIVPGFDPGKANFNLPDSILVEQEYVSQTPYFLRVSYILAEFEVNVLIIMSSDRQPTKIKGGDAP